MFAEQKVKNIYPEAELKYDWVTIESKWVWNTNGIGETRLKDREIYIRGVWIGNTCLACGGKFEHQIWRKAWKNIQKIMLGKLEN